jgi:hypothetical protein
VTWQSFSKQAAPILAYFLNPRSMASDEQRIPNVWRILFLKGQVLFGSDLLNVSGLMRQTYGSLYEHFRPA